MKATEVVTAAPCAKCPFRKDVPIYLRAGRREEIARVLADGGDFHCHATVDYSEEDDEGCSVPDTTDSVLCAGAMRSLMLSGGSNQHLRIAERLGIVTQDEIAGGSGPEVWPLHDWVTLAEGATSEDPETEEGDTCSIVDDGCLAPAGFLGAGGGVVRGTVYVDTYCDGCGEAVCENCMTDSGLCPYCDEEMEEDR